MNWVPDENIYQINVTLIGLLHSLSKKTLHQTNPEQGDNENTWCLWNAKASVKQSSTY